MSGEIRGVFAHVAQVVEYAKDALTKEVFSRVSNVGPEKALSQGFEATSKLLEQQRKDVATYRLPSSESSERLGRFSTRSEKCFSRSRHMGVL